MPNLTTQQMSDLEDLMCSVEEAFDGGHFDIEDHYDSPLWHECEGCNDAHMDDVRDDFECDCEPPEEFSTLDKEDWRCEDCEPEYETTECDCGWAQEAIEEDFRENVSGGDYHQMLNDEGWFYETGSSRTVWFNDDLGLCLKLENPDELDQNRAECEACTSLIAPHGAELNEWHELPSGREIYLGAPEHVYLSPNERCLVQSDERHHYSEDDGDLLHAYAGDPDENDDARWMRENISQDSYRHNYWVHGDESSIEENADGTEKATKLIAMVFDLGYVSGCRRGMEW